MSVPIYSIFSTGMVIMIGHKRFSIPSTDARFEKAKTLIKESKWDELTDYIDIEKSYGKYNLKLIDGSLHYDVAGEMHPIPLELSQRIIAYKDEGLSLVSLLAFWENLKKNPSRNSLQQLFKFLENNGHPFTDDGHFIAYKTVRTDFKDWHSNKMDNSIGKVVEIPRNMVNDDPLQTCSEGLHACSWAYLAHFHADKERKIVSVKINPADVVSVPVDYQNTKMRVCKYEVLDEVEADFSDILVYQKEERKDISFSDNDEDLCTTCDQTESDCDCYSCDDCSELVARGESCDCLEENEEPEEEVEEDCESCGEEQSSCECVNETVIHEDCKNCGEDQLDCECPDESMIPPIPQS